jgi:hypothetical protein
MPRTTTGHDWRLTERDGSERCIVCTAAEYEQHFQVTFKARVFRLPGLLVFPVCSILCAFAWSELIGRCLERDQQAMEMALAFIDLHTAP